MNARTAGKLICGATFTVGLTVLPIVWQSMPGGWRQLVGFVLVVGFAIGTIMVLRSRSETDGLATNEKHKNLVDQSINVQGTNSGTISQTNNNMINISQKTQRTLTREMKAQLLKEMPRDFPVRVLSMNGDTESQAYGREIHAFLAGNGFEMDQGSPTSHMFVDPPVHTVNISKFNEGNRQLWHLVVGPSGP